MTENEPVLNHVTADSASVEASPTVMKEARASTWHSQPPEKFSAAEAAAARINVLPTCPDPFQPAGQLWRGSFGAVRASEELISSITN